MNPISVYFDFLRKEGRPLSEINPGSEEIALTVNDALHALDLLNDGHIAILGGDILSEKKNSELTYAYKLWGAEYHYLNWYCDKYEEETETEYLFRCYNEAKKNILDANKIAINLNYKCFIVLVI